MALHRMEEKEGRPTTMGLLNDMMEPDKKPTYWGHNYYYHHRHLLYLLVRYNSDFRPKQLSVREDVSGDNNSLGMVEVLKCSFSHTYLQSFLSKEPNCFIMCIPGPEKVYNFRGIEKQLNVRDTYLYVSSNRITGEIVVHWDPDYYRDCTTIIPGLDDLQWVHYKLPIDLTMGNDIDWAENGRTINSDVYEDCGD